jgi:hypothetical protein
LRSQSCDLKFSEVAISSFDARTFGGLTNAVRLMLRELGVRAEAAPAKPRSLSDIVRARVPLAGRVKGYRAIWPYFECGRSSFREPAAELGFGALFGFWDGPPTEGALSDAGWRWFCDGYLALRQDQPLPRLELVGDLYGRQVARRRNQRFVNPYEAMQDSGTIDPYFAAVRSVSSATLVVSTADVPAGPAQPQVHPRRARLQAFLAPARARRDR